MACDKEVTWCGVSKLLRMCIYVDTIVEVGIVGLDSGYSR